jgi:hypothetical protein
MREGEAASTADLEDREDVVGSAVNTCSREPQRDISPMIKNSKSAVFAT